MGAEVVFEEPQAQPIKSASDVSMRHVCEFLRDALGLDYNDVVSLTIKPGSVKVRVLLRRLDNGKHFIRGDEHELASKVIDIPVKGFFSE